MTNAGLDANTGRSRNIFLDDWRNCLYAHYRHVVHEGDSLNETSLHQVLLTVGFTDEELTAQRDEILASVQVPVAEPEPEVVEALEPVEPVEPVETAEPVPETPVIAEIAPEPIAEQTVAPDPPEDEPPTPLVQMSLF